MAAKKITSRNPKAFRRTLQRYGVKTKGWGKKGPTKSVERLFKEIHVHLESELFLVNGKLERRVRRSQALILYRDNAGHMHRLRERQVYANGAEVLGAEGISVSEKRQRGESAFDALLRGLREELGVEHPDHSDFVFMRTAHRTSKSAKSYPTLRSECRVSIYVWFMPARFYKPEYIERQKNKTIYFDWVPYEGPVR